jgi:hypothetical protein
LPLSRWNGVDRNAVETPGPALLLEQERKLDLQRSRWEVALHAQLPLRRDLNRLCQIGQKHEGGAEVYPARAEVGEDGGQLGLIIALAETGRAEIAQDRVVAGGVGVLNGK